MTERPNFFLLLELDPAAPWNEEAFQHALAEKRKRWTRDATGPKTFPRTVDAKRNLNLVRDIQRVMGDVDAREEERKKAANERRAAMEAARKELKDRLDFLELRGYLLAPERESLRTGFADVLAASSALARRLDAVEVREAGPAAPADRLDDHTERQLRDLLKTAQMRTLYDVLKTVDESVTERSSLPVLLDAAHKLYMNEHNRKNKSDPAVKARENLAGIAKTIFETEERRRRHDVSMRLESLRELVAWHVEVLGSARAMTAAQVEGFLARAKRNGVRDLDFALGYLRDVLFAKGWPLELPAPEAAAGVDRLVHCPRCAELNTPAAAACSVCAFPLRDPCPSCGLVEPRRGGCRCGFPLGQRERVEDLLAEAVEAADGGRRDEAALLLNRASRIWRLPAGSTDPLAVRLRTETLRLAEEAAHLKRLADSVTALTGARRYVEAADLLRTAPLGLPDRDMLLVRAEEIVERARRLCEEARRPGVGQVRRIELLTEALRVCDDYVSARTELNRIPPASPRKARAIAGDPDTGVLVSWEETGEPGISYVVVRGTGPAPPESPEDLPGQQRLAEVSGASYRDMPDAESVGLPLTYAVFAVRSGTFSAPEVAAPVLVAADPELSCRAGEGEVALSWSPPRHADRIEIVRERIGGDEPPVRLLADGTEHTDRDVANGAVYRYTVRARYPGLGGGPVWSRGRTIETSLRRRPVPPGSLSLTGRAGSYLYAHKVELRIPESDRGEVRIISQRGAGSLREGDAAAEAEFRPGGRILAGSSSPFVDLITSPDDRFFTYVPIVTVDGHVYVGRPRSYVTDPDVADLAVEFDGDQAHVGWTWPESGGRALVGWNTEGGLPDVTEIPEPHAVTRPTGETYGGCTVRIPADATALHVVVALTVTHAHTEFATSGVRASLIRPLVRARYEVRGGWRQRSELVLTAETPLDLPALTLVARAGRAPLTRADGDVVLALPPSRLAGSKAHTMPRAHHLHYRLFTADPADAAAVELTPATH
ncbi:hypothetical protein ABGB12_18075 [Actinocorallia sp. B10E7]|uniref:hypothetical protein n=1 Tax=Actinocorallia sp. B10E7 TaxID=3153558 RepID=UPI00325EE0A6